MNIPHYTYNYAMTKESHTKLFNWKYREVLIAYTYKTYYYIKNIHF
jgi:hypothetical protein